MTILYVLAGIIGFYLLCGAVVVWAALYYMVSTAHENADYAEKIRQYKAMSRKAKFHAWICAIWYGGVCWLPIALGWMVRPSSFLNGA